MRRWYFALIACAIMNGSVSSGVAQETQAAIDKQAYEMYQQVFSPFCPGRSLNDCPSSKAQDLKLEMRQKLERGEAPQTILDEVFQRFGEKFRAVPRYAGFGKLVWWVPVGFLIVGALIIGFSIRRSRRCMPCSVIDKLSTPVDGALYQKIQEELDDFTG